jgi:hypothetical protein
LDFAEPIRIAAREDLEEALDEVETHVGQRLETVLSEIADEITRAKF